MNFRWDVVTDQNQYDEVLEADRGYWSRTEDISNPFVSPVDQAEEVLALNEIYCTSSAKLNRRDPYDFSPEQLDRMLYRATPLDMLLMEGEGPI